MVAIKYSKTGHFFPVSGIIIGQSEKHGRAMPGRRLGHSYECVMANIKRRIAHIPVGQSEHLWLIFWETRRTWLRFAAIAIPDELFQLRAGYNTGPVLLGQGKPGFARHSDFFGDCGP